jgi:spore coat-associated protein N
VSRISLLIRQPRKLVVSLATVLAAVGLVVGSSASFSSTSANPSNTFSGGNLTHGNSKAGSAILTADKMIPGESKNGTVVITNTGDVAGNFTLAKSNLTDTPGANGGVLSGKLDLKVEDVTGTPTTVYDGKLDAMGTQTLGSFASGAARTYKFTVTFPDGGVPGSATTGDNAYKGSSTSVQFDWNATS